MKKYILLFILIIPYNLLAQQRKYSHFHEQRSSLFELLTISPTDIVFMGNSITNGGEWCELFDNKNFKNRGISGDKSAGILERIDYILEGQPQKIFLMIGINDIATDIPVDSIAMNIEQAIKRIKIQSKQTQLYLQSVLPTNPDFNMFQNHMKPDKIKELNEQIIQLSVKYNVTYIDLYSHFIEKGTDKMNPEYTNDGLHLMGKGYLHWRDLLIPYINE